MAGLGAALIPQTWLRAPARSARLRLTLMYSGMFLALGTVIVAAIFALGSGSEAIRVSSAVPVSALGRPNVHAVISQQHSVDINRFLAASWLTLTLTALASLPLGWFLAGRTLRPLRQMTTAARAITAGNLHQRLAVAGADDEFKQLGDTFDELLSRLEASFASQKRFVANAAHELRTPLTVERTLLQVALADPQASAATLRAACEEVLASGRDHQQLLDSLLTLATSERGLDHHRPLELAQLAAESLAMHAADIDRRAIRLTASLAPAPASGDPALVRRLIDNLVDNAIRYNQPDGMIEVSTTTQSACAVLSVTNAGQPVAPDEIDRLFEPFQRIGHRTSADGHPGLGLSIVSAIASAHDAAVVAVPSPSGGLVVSVSFPAWPSLRDHTA